MVTVREILRQKLDNFKKYIQSEFHDQIFAIEQLGKFSTVSEEELIYYCNSILPNSKEELESFLSKSFADNSIMYTDKQFDKILRYLMLFKDLLKPN